LEASLSERSDLNRRP